MSGIFQAIQRVINELLRIIGYFFERSATNYRLLEPGAKVMTILFIIILILLISYVVLILLRASFRYDLRDLENIRWEFEITLNRFKGEKCNLFYEIILFQKIVVFDDVVYPDPKEVLELQKFKEREIEQEEQRINSDEYLKWFKVRTIVSTVFIVLIIITLFFRKYNDFDLLFRGIYNLKYQQYIIRNNLGSLMFIFGFIISIVMTVFAWIYTYGKDEWKGLIEKKTLFESFEIISLIPTFVAILTIMNAFIISPASVTMKSMEPNYSEGDTVFALHTSKYERLDVVIVLVEEGEYIAGLNIQTRNLFYIKRIIGMPGETITMMNGELYIDGSLFDESEYLMDYMQTYCETGISYDASETCSFYVPEGQYFLLGDNRINSADSRSYGTFSLEDIYGKVIFKLG